MGREATRSSGPWPAIVKASRRRFAPLHKRLKLLTCPAGLFPIGKVTTYLFDGQVHNESTSSIARDGLAHIISVLSSGPVIIRNDKDISPQELRVIVSPLSCTKWIGRRGEIPFLRCMNILFALDDKHVIRFSYPVQPVWNKPNAFEVPDPIAVRAPCRLLNVLQSFSDPSIEPAGKAQRLLRPYSCRPRAESNACRHLAAIFRPVRRSLELPLWYSSHLARLRAELCDRRGCTGYDKTTGRCLALR